MNYRSVLGRREKRNGCGRDDRGLRRSKWGVRKRATATAVAVVAVALLLGAASLLMLLHQSLVSTTEGAAQRRAGDVVAMISRQDVSEAGQALTTTAHTGQYVQIVAPDGSVVASSVPAAMGSPLSALRPLASQTVTQTVSGLPNVANSDSFLVVAAGVDSDGGTYTVLVASTLQVQLDTVATVAWFILGATPLLLIVVGVSVWVLVGRSLRPVERIRTQVGQIKAPHTGERVEVPRTNDEIHELALTMNSMLDRLEISDREQRRFVSDASHELRSPLATLTAGLEIAASDPSGAMWTQMRDLLGAEASRMRYLVDDLLTLAKASDEGIRVNAEEVDLDDVLDFEVRRLRALTPLRVHAEIAPVRITGDPRRLAQVVRNVLDNSNRHARSAVWVSLSRAPEGILMIIDNDGDPVPERDRERIFDRFVRLDDSRSRESGGSGLGLAIAVGIMQAHHGTVIATESECGRCRFELRLPAELVNKG
ncbi:HAMP domain-containing protein [Paenarthrobacter sp. Z7-10]|uniref:sensor histidine kinase n=1 Tax=Paenarthrobacter sp. Z7-10 TaxID=2787635 RepID=UPI0022A95878|nr:ATP-binding protein [Paenarthrobacter sp. Z7-10]MCZ2404871.1 HAMP domain-containing protein [Paenarthrobacter sp. Z7-10]